jgi:hypothetical protein
MTDPSEVPFALTRPANGKRQVKFENNQGTQHVLFAGEHCVAGQLDLWNPDGPRAQEQDDDSTGR